MKNYIKSSALLFSISIIIVIIGFIFSDSSIFALGFVVATVAGSPKMQKAKELREKRLTLIESAEAVSEMAEGENRDFTTEEQTNYDNFLAQAEALLGRAKRLENEAITSAENEARKIPKPSGGEMRAKKEATKRYSFLKAIRAKVEGKQLEGIEAEIHQEAQREAAIAGVNISGFGVPSFFMDIEKRDLTAGTTTQGGHTIQTDLETMIPVLRPKLQTVALGATQMSGLSGPVDIPRNDAAGSGTWAGENVTATETNQTFDKISLTANRLAAFTDVSKQLIFQSSISVENFVRQDLEQAIRTAVDLAAINGSGSGSQPTGILNIAGIGSVLGGTNGASPTLAHFIQLEEEVAIDNADVGNLSYFTNPKVRSKAKQTFIDSGSGLRIWDVNSNSVNGYPVAVSTQVPSNLTKGSSSGVASAIIFGNWNDLIIANWGGIDIVVDIYSRAKDAIVTLIVNSWWDIAVRHPESFAAMKDALTT